VSQVPRLQAALAAEHAAVFGYGAVGARLAGSARAEAAAADAAHRARRDAVAAVLTGLGEVPGAAERAYTLPFPVTSGPAALRLAVLLEERVASTWRAALPDTTGPVRRAALAALTDCAVRAVRWRQRATPRSPATVPFPGA